MAQTTLELFNLLPVNSSIIANMFIWVPGYSQFPGSMGQFEFQSSCSSSKLKHHSPVGDSNL